MKIKTSETKIKTSHLIGPPLDWAVTQCEGTNYYGPAWTRPSTDWKQGGPIIEREGIELKRGLVKPFVWAAFAYQAPRAHNCGPTPLIAAMRCYVSSKLGDEIDVPNELLEK